MLADALMGTGGVVVLLVVGQDGAQVAAGSVSGSGPGARGAGYRSGARRSRSSRAPARRCTAALDAAEEPLPEISSHVYRHLRLPDSEIRILLQKTEGKKASKERMHLDLETDNVEAEVERLENLGATRRDHQKERGFDFWVMRDPWDNEFCVLQTEFPELLSKREPWND